MVPIKVNKKRNKSTNKFFINLIDNLNRFEFAGIINAGTHGIKTSMVVQDYLNAHLNRVSILNEQYKFFELRKLNQWKNINHWLVVGTTWQICVHLNDIGLCSFSTMMRQHPELNFYGASWGFLKHNLTTTTDEDFDTDLLTWSGCGELFKLTAEAPGGQRFAIHPTVAIRNKYIDATPH